MSTRMPGTTAETANMNLRTTSTWPPYLISPKLTHPLGRLFMTCVLVPRLSEVHTQQVAVPRCSSDTLPSRPIEVEATTIEVMGPGGFTQKFRILRTQKLLRLRATIEKMMVEQGVDDHGARIFWKRRSSDWQLVSDDDTPGSLCMKEEEMVCYTWHIVVVINAENSSGSGRRYPFGVAPTCALDTLRGRLLSRSPDIQAGRFRLQYNDREVGPSDTPQTLGGEGKIIELLVKRIHSGRLTQTHIEILWNYFKDYPTINCNTCYSLGVVYELPSNTMLDQLAEHCETHHPQHCDALVAQTRRMTDKDIQEWLKELDAE
ncbi:hypothetical protein B0H14DRAFT_3893338 [Mycena olivaceomarginata]|nr:hypothetical protein B0H14DRAFT_3893338 [Mycena olivaceomarginata]